MSYMVKEVEVSLLWQVWSHKALLLSSTWPSTSWNSKRQQQKEDDVGSKTQGW